MGKLIRKTWPRIRKVIIKSEILYQIDGRRKGTNGEGREYRKTKKDAEKRAQELESDFRLEGAEGLNMSAELRVEALRADAKLSKYGKSLTDAVGFFLNFLEQEEIKKNSLTISTLADEWLADKTKKLKKGLLRQDTINAISETSELLKEKWGKSRIAEMSERIFRDYLDSLEVSQRRVFNVRSLLCQFFNWCIAQKHTKENPLDEIVIELIKKDVEILEVAQCLKLMRRCESTYPDLTVYHAICLFGGLRPTEAKLLRWENINLSERQITVLGSTSKTKDTRNVKIENTLFQWLDGYKGERNGFIVKQRGFRTAVEKLRSSLGYRLKKHNSKEFWNPDGPKWIDDVARHSYASYWLAKYNDRGHLAEQMGNSIKMIKDHYKKIVKSSDVELFWNILPKEISDQTERDFQEIERSMG
ncbi:MAG: site-specific integrase [Verrucomicrobiaceae bacterium]|nr:MAG: site-specific integrase [Verrucomicrobiaceae bacterium]